MRIPIVGGRYVKVTDSFVDDALVFQGERDAVTGGERLFEANHLMFSLVGDGLPVSVCNVGDF